MQETSLPPFALAQDYRDHPVHLRAGRGQEPLGRLRPGPLARAIPGRGGIGNPLRTSAIPMVLVRTPPCQVLPPATAGQDVARRNSGRERSRDKAEGL